MNIKVFDADFDYIYTIDEFIELLVDENFSSTSSVTIKLRYESDDAHYLQLGLYLQVNDDWYIITKVTQNYEFVQAQAFSPHFILAGGITKPMDGQDYWGGSGPLDAVCKIMLRQAEQMGIFYTSPVRFVPPVVSIQATYKNIADEISELCSSNGSGIKYIPDTVNKQFEFDTVPARETDYKFGPQYDNVKSYEYTVSSVDTVTTAYVGGQGEGKDREIVIVGNETTGVARREIFVDARDVEPGKTALLEQRGKNQLKPDAISIKAEIDTNANLRYGQDYRLGDYATIYVPVKSIAKVDGKYEKRDGYCVTYQLLTNVKRHYFNGLEEIYCTFGYPPEGQANQIKKQQRQIAQLNTR